MKAAISKTSGKAALVKPAAKKTVKPAKKSGATPGDAIAILEADHKKVKSLFNAFKKLKKSAGSDAAKEDIVRQICAELVVHATVEEEIFYPAVRQAINDDDLMDEADVEHAEAKGLIAQLQTMKAGEDHYDAKVTVLGENIDHHVQEEEGDMFKKARRAKIDAIGLGAMILQRKGELQGLPAVPVNPTEQRPSLAKRLFGN